MNPWVRFVVILFCFLTVACGADSTPMATAIPTISNIPTETLTPVLTKTPLPTSVTQVSSTHEPTPTIPPATMEIVATMEAIVTEKPELGEYYSRACVVYSACLVSSELFALSPDKKWATFFTSKGSGGLSIVGTENNQQWNVTYQDITGNNFACECSVEIEHWSHDGNYLYVSPRTPGGGGPFWYWRDYIQLIRINLNNGTWVDTKMGSAFSFSPNDRYIAYRRAQDVVIHEFQTGKEQIFRLPAEYVVFGRFLWSQDSKQIIFISSPVDEAVEKPKGFSLFLLNVDDMSVRTILEKDERYLFPVEWQTPNLILLEGLFTVSSGDTLKSGGKKYLLDLQTNSISEYQSP